MLIQVLGGTMQKIFILVLLSFTLISCGDESGGNAIVGEVGSCELVNLNPSYDGCIELSDSGLTSDEIIQVCDSLGAANPVGSRCEKTISLGDCNKTTTVNGQAVQFKVRIYDQDIADQRQNCIDFGGSFTAD